MGRRRSSEYHHRFLSKAFGGNSRLACYVLAGTIFSLGIFRDMLLGANPPRPTSSSLLRGRYERALRHQPSHALLETDAAKVLAYGLLAAGNTLVLSSMWALGLTGTYLGDYFGILMDARVTSFPFSVTDAPMYYGSTMSFLGTALLYGKPAGILLTAEVLLVYLVALTFEEYVFSELLHFFGSRVLTVQSPFTAEIYAKRERERASGRSGKKSS